MCGGVYECVCVCRGCVGGECGGGGGGGGVVIRESVDVL